MHTTVAHMTVAMLTAFSLATAATAAAAATQVSDVDYLHAARCRGLAVGLGSDASGLTAFVKAQAQGRTPEILDRADDAFASAKREAHGDARERLSAELSGACAAYASPAKTASAR